jgi:hypothetical protein
MLRQPHEHQQQNKTTLSPFPFPLREMFKKLISIRQITLISQKPFYLPHLKWYKTKKICEYHDGAMEHNGGSTKINQGTNGAKGGCQGSLMDFNNKTRKPCHLFPCL